MLNHRLAIQLGENNRIMNRKYPRFNKPQIYRSLVLVEVTITIPYVAF